MTTEKQELMETRLKILLAQFALYLADDTGRENDNHEYWINGFIKLYTNELQAVVQRERDKNYEDFEAYLSSSAPLHDISFKEFMRLKSKIK